MGEEKKIIRKKGRGNSRRLVYTLFLVEFLVCTLKKEHSSSQQQTKVFPFVFSSLDKCHIS